jgi:serine/threonine protein kinase
MLDAQFRPVLIDFDIADVRFLTEQKLTSGGLGTPMFASPEQLECAGEVDERADVYSLGRLLHYMLIERIPTCSEQDALLDTLSRFPTSLPLTVQRATQRDPCDRFKSVDQLRRDVESYKTGWAAARGNFRRGLHWVRRNAMLVVVATSGITATLAYAKYQEDLATTHLQYQMEAQENLEEMNRLTEKLTLVEAELKEARKQHDELRRSLDDTRSKLAQLEKLGPASPGSHQQQATMWRANIMILEGQMKEAQLRLDSANRQLEQIVAEIDQARREQRGGSGPAPATASSAPSASGKPGPAVGSATTPPTPISPPKSTAATTRVKKVEPQPVDLITRREEVQQNLAKLKPAIRRCPGIGASRGEKVGVLLRVDEHGSVIKVTNPFGNMADQARSCMYALIMKRKFSPMKPGSEPSVQSVDYTF